MKSGLRFRMTLAGILFVGVAACYEATEKGDDGGQAADKGQVDMAPAKWVSTKALPVPVTTHAVVAYKGYIYVIGGTTKTGSPPAKNGDVYYAKVGASGTITTWGKTTTPGGNWHNLDATVHDGVIYAGGGSNGYGALSKVMYSKIVASDGSLGVWKSATSLTTSRENAALVAHKGYLYVVGGRDGMSKALDLCSYTSIISGGGSLGTTWLSCPKLPQATTGHQHGAVVYGDKIYVFGGKSYGTKDLYWSSIASNGALGSWNIASVSFDTTANVALAAKGSLFAVGGSGPSSSIADVYTSKVTSTGAPGTWSKLLPLPKAKSGHDGAVANGHLIIIGGTEPGMAGYSSTTSVFSFPLL